MYCVIYKFNPKPNKEAEYIKCWEEMTQLIRKELGGLGSRLHRTDKGELFAYAQWPDKESWEKMRSHNDTGRMAELSQLIKEYSNPSEVIFSGEGISDLID